MLWFRTATLLLALCHLAQLLPGVTSAPWWDTRATKPGSFSFDPSSPIGPEQWGDIYPSCNGQRQSPIAITTADVHASKWGRLRCSGCYTIEFTDAIVTVNQNELKATAVYAKGQTPYTLSGSSLGDDVYTLLQMHLHIPGEHSVNGEMPVIENHWGFQNEVSGRLAVIVELFRIGEDSGNVQLLIDGGWAALASWGDDDYHNVSSISGFFPRIPPITTSSYWFYEGGLTTPPCSEVVTFYIYQKFSSISLNQLRAIDAILREADPPGQVFMGNSRPPQPVNDRDIYEQRDVDSELYTETYDVCITIFFALALWVVGHLFEQVGCKFVGEVILAAVCGPGKYWQQYGVFLFFLVAFLLQYLYIYI